MVANRASGITTLTVAQEMKCAVIDLNALTRELFNRLEASHSFHLQPEGDRTHFTPTGARIVAALVAEALEQQIVELRNFVDQRELERH